MDDENQLATELDEGNLVDEAEKDETVTPHRYAITSFGADYDVDGFVKRLNRGDVFVPAFQRDFVWSHREASRFVESLLLGLPVPGVILARESDTNKLLVIDGQQRLRTLQFFYEGHFNPKPDDKHQKVFKLVEVQSRYEGATYRSLEQSDRVHLDNSIIHATIVKQDAPQEDDTSIYHIFERLNSGGRKLFPHEIRLATFYGSLIDSLKEWNENRSWRQIFGKRNKRLKDQELILRFLALFEDHKRYRRPMAEFLNIFAKRNRNPGSARLEVLGSRFSRAIETIYGSIGEGAFRTPSVINAAVFDAVMVGVARRLEAGGINDNSSLKAAYAELLRDPVFKDATDRATSDNSAVAARIDRATDILANAR